MKSYTQVRTEGEKCLLPPQPFNLTPTFAPEGTNWSANTYSIIWERVEKCVRPECISLLAHLFIHLFTQTIFGIYYF